MPLLFLLRLLEQHAPPLPTRRATATTTDTTFLCLFRLHQRIRLPPSRFHRLRLVIHLRLRLSVRLRQCSRTRSLRLSLRLCFPPAKPPVPVLVVPVSVPVLMLVIVVMFVVVVPALYWPCHKK